MNKVPLLSVFMITYNHEKFISKALQGILSQETDFPFELIIGEDSGNDSTRDICEEFSRNNLNIRLLPNEKYNLGVTANAVRTFKACQGKYIAICEGDDYWTDPCKLQKQFDFLEKNSDYVLVHHNAKTIDENDKIINESNLPPANCADLSEEDLKRGKIISTLTVCFRNVINEFPHEFYNIPIPDLFLISLLGRHGKAKYMPDIEPAMYREHSGGIWSSLNLQRRTRAKIRTWYVMSQYFKRIGDDDLYRYYLKKASASTPALIKLSFLNRDFKETVNASTDFLFRLKWHEFRSYIGVRRNV